MKTNVRFLQTAEQLRPEMIYRKVSPVRTISPADGTDDTDFDKRELSAGDSVCLDFGEHLVGRLTLAMNYSGSHPDAPVWLRLKFAERLCELSENVEEYKGWISKGWIQQEQLHTDIIPCRSELPRRYAFRYVLIEVLDISGKFRLRIDEAFCTAQSSADMKELLPFVTDNELHRKLDLTACATLKECMQEVFEDGPKRDRRLWLGDLRLQALANYRTFGHNDLVKRCLYLFAASTLSDGRVSACIFTEPTVEADDTVMFDYSLLYIPTLLDYYRETGDADTLRDLHRTALDQIRRSQPYFDENGLVMDSDKLGWCFTDWNLELNKQASAQGIYLYCLDAAIEIADILGLDNEKEELINDRDVKRSAALSLFDRESGLFVSGADRQISLASQVWMLLSGVLDRSAGIALIGRLENARGMVKAVTPYMYHNYIDALITYGEKEKALGILESYWGGMLNAGADTFWELYDPEDPDASPYGGTIVNSYCHAWSCAPAYFLRKYFGKDE